MIRSLFLFAGSAFASSVVSLTSKNFDSMVKSDSDSVWVVGFFATWCGHCKTYKPEFEKAAKALKGAVKFGAVYEEEKDLMVKYGVDGFPTIKAFVPGFKSPVPFAADRTAQGTVDFAFNQIKAMTNQRLNGKKDKKEKKDKGEKKDKKSEKKDKKSNKNSGNSVLALSQSDFEALVPGDSVVFVKFYAPWCGHCQKLAPDWEKLAAQLGSRVKVAKVDATIETGLAQRFGIKGYPSLKLFVPGKSKPIEYNGERSVSAMEEFALKHVKKVVELKQLTNSESLQDGCGKSTCVIAFLPHITDSNNKERLALLKKISDGVSEVGDTPIKSFWSQGGDQLPFEEALQLSFGYPAMIVLNLEKGLYGIHKGNLEKEGVKEFLKSIMGGRADMRETPKLVFDLFKTVSEWNSKKEEL